MVSAQRLQALERQLQTSVVLLDGGFGTELEKDPRVKLGTSSLWSASLLLDENQHLQSVITDVHKRYYLAGADVAITSSYQASEDGFRREGVTSEAKVKEYFATSIDLAVQARDEAWKELKEPADRIKPLVAASIGCYAAYLADGSEYTGKYDLTKDELVWWHKDRFAFFDSYEGVDFLIIETVPCLSEVDAFMDLLNEFPNVRAMIAVACHSETELNSGEKIVNMLPLLKKLKNPAQLLAVGINCTPPQYVEGLLRALDCSWPKVVYPNSGEGWDGVNKTWLPAESGGLDGPWTQYLSKWYDAGARVFGGCCRTAPEDIRSMREHFLSPQ